MLPLVIATGCFACPETTPVIIELDDEVSFDDTPGHRLFGTIETRPGTFPGQPSFVCSASCAEPWADVWAGTRDVPFVGVALPWAMPPTDSNGRDFIARLGVSIDPGATGETTCDVVVGGHETWTLTVEAP